MIPVNHYVGIILLLFSPILIAEEKFDLYEQFAEKHLIPIPADTKSYIQVLYITGLSYYHGADSEIGITLSSSWKNALDGNKNAMVITIKEYFNEDSGRYLQNKFDTGMKINEHELKKHIKTTSLNAEKCYQLVEKLIETVNKPFKNISSEDFGAISISNSNKKILVKAHGFGGAGKVITDGYGSIYDKEVRKMREIIKQCEAKLME